MIVANIVKVVQLRSVQEKGSGNAVNGSITPSLIEKATRFVKMIEIVFVLPASEKANIANLKVAPKVAQIIIGTL
jgi:hypothetical protein